MLELSVMDGKREVVLKFEHSLLSLSKWESKHKKPLLVKGGVTDEEMIEYFQDMLLSPKRGQDLVYRLSPDQLEELRTYMNDNRTASSVPAQKGSASQEQHTSELIYYWMVALQIPFHPAETWHLSRLMMLVAITSYKNAPAKKEKPTDVMKDWERINEERLKKYGTTG